jgi:hypothetical protein
MVRPLRERIEIVELLDRGDFAEASRRLAEPAKAREPQGPPPLLPPAVKRIIAAVEELDRALMGAAPPERLFAVFVSVEQLIAVYLKIAQLNTEFHSGCEAGSLPRSFFV